jgi:hypothetical protein
MLLLWVPFVCRFELKRDSGGDPVQRIEVRWMFISRVIDDFAATEREGRRAGEAGKEMDVRRIFELFRTLYRPVTALARRVVQRIGFAWSNGGANGHSRRRVPVRQSDSRGDCETRPWLVSSGGTTRVRGAEASAR